MIKLALEKIKYLEMDLINKRIIEYLGKNARSSYVEIGEHVGLSAPSVAERIQKMEDSGIIRGYTVQLDLTKLEYHIQAQIALKIDSNKFRVFLCKWV